MYKLPIILSLIAVLGIPAVSVAQDETEVDASAPLCVRIVTVVDAAASPGPGASAAPNPTLVPDLSAEPRVEPSASPGASLDPAASAEDSALADALADGSATLELVPAEECAADIVVDHGGEDTAANDGAEPEATAAPDGEPQPRDRGRTGQKGTPYARFVARGVSAVVSLVTLVRENDGADTQAEVAGAARRLERWANGQRRWLRNHPPQRCYRNAHRRWLSGISTVADGARDLRIGVLELDARQAGRGARRLTAGTARISAIDFDATTERCIGAAGRR